MAYPDGTGLVGRGGKQVLGKNEGPEPFCLSKRQRKIEREEK